MRLQPSLQEGLARQRAGDLAGAEAIYGAILKRRPRESMAKTLLGLTLCQGERFEDGVKLLRDAIRIDDRAFSHFSLGEALASKGRLTEAVPAFRRSIHLQPDILAAYTGLGRALITLGDYAGAAQPLRAALKFAPQEAEPYFCTALLLHRLGRHSDAAVQLQVAVELAPGRADAWLLLGDTLHAAHDDEPAIIAYQRAIAITPELADAYSHMSNALYDASLFEKAADAASHAIELQPGFAEAYSNLGNALQALLRFAEAEAAYRQALALRPDSAAFHSNLGVVLTAQNRLAEALEAQRKALSLDPDFLDANYNHAITLLLDGQYRPGWQYYEHRWRLSWSKPRPLQRPRWAGEELLGRTILLHAEQGLGDTLMMARFAPLVAARGGRVLLEVQAPLVRLLGCLPGVSQVLSLGADLPSFDVHCPLFSLPLLFDTTLDTVPSAPYLSADPALAPQPSSRSGLRIGLVWAGAERIGRHVNQERSITLDQLAPIAAMSGVTCFSLQKDPDPGSAHHAARLGIVNLMDGVEDFADTAARVAQLDLVISVDTSTAHLAAAMGKPVWLLSRYNGCWRWLSGRSDSPWYPSLRVYRQRQPSDWAPVVAQIAADLTKLSCESSGSSCRQLTANHRQAQKTPA